MTMGMHALDAGINLIPALIGIYAVGELINASKSFDKRVKIETNYKIRGFGFTWQEFKEQFVNMLTSGVLGQRFDDIAASLTTNRFGVADAYMIMADFQDYSRAQRDVAKVYRDRDRFNRMMLVNTAKSGVFSADRSVQEYVDNIWKL
jgi:starch phosphorylase